MLRRHVVLALVIVVPLLVTSCEDDTVKPPPMVTIAGIVRDVDRAVPAAGVRVRLYGTNYIDNVPTGTDGRYSIEVPQGSKLQLFTDDFDTAAADVWFPLVNVDHPHIYANQDMLDWPIHCCPRSACPEKLSVAIWDNYLQHADGPNGDLFVPTSAAASGGILAIICLENSDGAIDSVRIQSNTPHFPDGFCNAAVAWDSVLMGCDPNASVLHSRTRTSTDLCGGYASFGNPAFTGQSVTLTITDAKPSRNYAFATPWEVPVAPGMITLGWIMVVDGVPNRSLRDLACAANWFMCSP